MKRFALAALLPLLIPGGISRADVVNAAPVRVSVGIPTDVMMIPEFDRELLRFMVNQARLADIAPDDYSLLRLINIQLLQSLSDKSMAMEGDLLGRLAPNFIFAPGLLYDSSIAIDAVNTGVTSLAIVRGDVLDGIDPIRREHVRNVAMVDQDAGFKTLLVLKRTSDANSAPAKGDRLAFCGRGVPNEALDWLSEHGMDWNGDFFRSSYYRRGMDPIDGLDAVLEGGASEVTGLDVAVVEPATWAYYEREKPVRAARMVILEQGDGYVALGRDDDVSLRPPESEPLSHIQLQGKRLGFFVKNEVETSLFASWGLPPDAVERGAIKLGPAMAGDFATTEDVLDDLVDANGVDAALVQRVSWEQYQRRKPGRASQLHEALALPEIPAPMLIANTDLVPEAQRKALRDALVNTEGLADLKLGLSYGMLLGRVEPHFVAPPPDVLPVDYNAPEPVSLPPAPASLRFTESPAIGPANVAQRALGVFSTYCAACHAPDARDQNDFNYVTDLSAIVKNGLVVPGNASASRLYQRLIAGEMPPNTVVNRPSAGDIEAIRQWIDAGAPAR